MGCTNSATAAPAKPVTKRSASPVAGGSYPGVVEEDFHRKYQLGMKIGKGAFAQVHDVFEIKAEQAALVAHWQRWRGRRNSKSLAVWLAVAAGYVSSPPLTAVKILDLRDDKKKEAVQKRHLAENEVMLWKAVGDHVNCVRMREAFFDPMLCYMVMDKCPCSLIKYLGTLKVINERSLATVCAQMLSGIAHVHKARIVHCNVKHDNFMVAGSDGHTVKLSDFGLSRLLPPLGDLTGVSGTAPFMCPEMLETKRFDMKADVWSLGVVIHTLFCGDLPYKPKEQTSRSMKEAIKHGGHLVFKQRWLSSNARDFLRSLLNRDSHQRICALEAGAMPYITNVADGRDTKGTIESYLPSLRFALRAIKHMGVCGDQIVARPSSVDVYLNDRQTQCHGKLHRQTAGATGNSQTTITPDAAAECSKVSEDTASTVSTQCGSSRSLPSYYSPTLLRL